MYCMKVRIRKDKIQVISPNYTIENSVLERVEPEYRDEFPEMYYKFEVNSRQLRVKEIWIKVLVSDALPYPPSRESWIYPEPDDSIRLLADTGERIKIACLTEVERRSLERIIKKVCKDKESIRKAYIAFWKQEIQRNRKRAQSILNDAEQSEKALETLQESW